MKKTRLRAGLFQRNVGLLCSLLFTGISGRSAFAQDSGSWLSAVNPLGYALIALLFLASARFERWRLVQPAALFLIEPIHTLSGAECPCGLASSIVAAFLLYRMGYFAPGRSWKAFVIFACGIAAELATFALARRSLPVVGLYLVYYVVFSAVVFCMVRYGDGSDISARKPVLKLESIGLTERERRFVRAFVEGKSLKQISIETHFSESTIRSAFCSIYRKLGIRRCEDLAVLGERYRIDYSGKDDRRRTRGRPAHEYTGPAAAETSAPESPARRFSRAASSLAKSISPMAIFRRADETPAPFPSPSEQPPAPKPRPLLKQLKKR